MSDPDETDEYLLVAIRKTDALALMQWWFTTDKARAPQPVKRICGSVRAKLLQFLQLKDLGD